MIQMKMHEQYNANILLSMANLHIELESQASLALHKLVKANFQVRILFGLCAYSERSLDKEMLRS